VLECFRGWHPLVERVLAATPEAVILRNDVYEHRPRTRWGRGRVTLLGDAAHTMTPNLGQGACQAIEDAWVLGQCCRQPRAIPASLRAYEARRIWRTLLVAQQSHLTGRFAQVEHPLACRMRDALTRRTPELLLAKQLEWIVGHEA
jgi:2-polyprenyl-6-methoxyphenol hydroxylase-like FAD-dependent oxidoreductase